MHLVRILSIFYIWFLSYKCELGFHRDYPYTLACDDILNIKVDVKHLSTNLFLAVSFSYRFFSYRCRVIALYDSNCAGFIYCLILFAFLFKICSKLANIQLKNMCICLLNCFIALIINFLILLQMWCYVVLLLLFTFFRDIAPEGNDLGETNANLDELVDLALTLQEATGIRPLWATCNLFSNPRYVPGNHLAVMWAEAVLRFKEVLKFCCNYEQVS